MGNRLIVEYPQENEISRHSRFRINFKHEFREYLLAVDVKRQSKLIRAACNRLVAECSEKPAQNVKRLPAHHSSPLFVNRR